MKISPTFIDSGPGKILVTEFVNDTSAVDKAVLIIPPIAEEMNKSRRMLALMAKAACDVGYHVLLPDLYGTGDSEGEFGSSSWSQWCSDIDICINYLKTKGFNDLSILALRGGALLAFDSLSNCNVRITKLILWQPVVSGDLWLTQFLRLRLASAMIAANGEKESVKELKQKLAAGESIEVAGYELSPDLYSGLVKSSLKKKLPDNINDVFWMELVATEGKGILPMSKKVIELWQERGQTQSIRVVGDPFRNTSEITEVHVLIQATLEFLSVSNE